MLQKSRRRLSVLQVTAIYPSSANPAQGSFVKSQIDSIRPFVDVELFIIRGLSGIVPYIRAIPSLCLKLYFGKMDVIHVHYGNTSSLVKFLYWGRKPIITSYCGDDLLGTLISPGKYLIKSLFFVFINRLFARRDACAIVKSSLLGKKLKKTKRVEVIPNGIDFSLFKEIDKATAREKVGVHSNDIKVLLFPADPQIPVKNFALLKTALEQLETQNFLLLTFTGNKVNRELVPYYFNASDLVVFTSLSEGSPNVIKEAMACNCRIFTTNCGDVSFLLDGVKESRILSYEVEDWVEALLHFFSEPQLLKSNGRNELRSKKLDIESVAQRIIEVYNSVI